MNTQCRPHEFTKLADILTANNIIVGEMISANARRTKKKHKIRFFTFFTFSNIETRFDIYTNTAQVDSDFLKYYERITLIGRLGIRNFLTVFVSFTGTRGFSVIRRPREHSYIRPNDRTKTNEMSNIFTVGRTNLLAGIILFIFQFIFFRPRGNFDFHDRRNGRQRTGPH